MARRTRRRIERGIFIGNRYVKLKTVRRVGFSVLLVIILLLIVYLYAPSNKPNNIVSKDKDTSGDVVDNKDKTDTTDKDTNKDVDNKKDEQDTTDKKEDETKEPEVLSASFKVYPTLKYKEDNYNIEYDSNNGPYTLIDTAGEANNGTIYYCISEGTNYSINENDKSLFKEDINISANGVGTYCVWAYVKGDGDYLDSDIVKVGTITIASSGNDKDSNVENVPDVSTGIVPR